MYKETGGIFQGLYGKVKEKKKNVYGMQQEAKGTVVNSKTWSNNELLKMNDFVNCSFRGGGWEEKKWSTYKTKETIAKCWNYQEKKLKIFNNVIEQVVAKIGYKTTYRY